MKCNLLEYFSIEEKLQSLIYKRFGLVDITDEEANQIREIDDTLLYYEFEALADLHIHDDPPYKAMEHDFSQREFACVEKEFFKIFMQILPNFNKFAMP